MLKAYKYCIKPSSEQAEKFAQFFGCTRFAFNWGLDQKIKLYTESKESISCFKLTNKLTSIKKEEEFSWLNEVHSQVLQMSLRRLDNAFQKFFSKSLKAGFPRFKSRKNPVQTFQYPQGVKVDFESSTIFLPKIGKVNCIFHRKFVGKIKTCTISKSSTGKYFVSILVDNDEPLPAKVNITSEKQAIGIDVGIKEFATCSNGEVVSNPKYLKNKLARLAVKQRQLSKKVKGSNNRNKAKYWVARVHESISNQRNDFLHKLSNRLVRDNQAVIIEDLHIKGMIKNHCLAQAISDVSWSKFFEYLAYKAEWQGKHLIQIIRFAPSSQICSNCGTQNPAVKDLVVRNWICSVCNAKHNRDLNASINIRNFGLIQVGFKELEPTINKSERSGVGYYELRTSEAHGSLARG